MLDGFENITHELTDYERDVLLPLIIRGLSTKRGKDKAITNKKIVEALKEKGYKITEVRVRKLINHVRVKGLVPGLIATSQGYYISSNPEEVLSYVKSLAGRANEINRVKDSMITYLRTLKAS